ncbi:DNA cytosine methyltransferase [Lysobacter sp. Root96]|uniref:DNA cytosine methyltransferase n=1 Tax=Lysobacter sp. Root96 TaxID=1736612 RepID=UPI0006FF689C|nr:DNA cytosine methyltransferase [Lysobacter sp. Root96]KRD71399.1 DNA methyltransferase [Lysobacter sp. Root96]
MADGSRGFNFPVPQVSRLRPGEIVVDLFAGGGGASEALEGALSRAVDIAINHNPWAVALHAANHPLTKHLCQDVWEADPRIECGGQPVGWLHASPDCTHFSQAKGGQRRDRATRSLSWVALRWVGTVRPRIVSLENVKEILKWGPLIAKRDKATGRVVTLDMIPAIDPDTGKVVMRKGKVVMTNRIADPGEVVSVHNQFLIPDKRHEGRTWRQFVASLQQLGYVVEWRRLRACDYGAGTTRERLFMVARCDGEPICWPAPTHGPSKEVPFVTAADCIDWSIDCPSIFSRQKPLADATHRRIARGLKRYVLESADPFIVGVGGRMGQTMERPVSEPAQTITAKADSSICVPTLVQCANASSSGIASGGVPLGVVTAWPRGGSHALAAPVLVQSGYGEREGQAPRSLDLEVPLGVAVAGGVKHAIAEAALAPVVAKFRAGSDGSSAGEPLPTITSGAGAARPAGCAHALGIVTAHLHAMAQNVPHVDPEAPLPTILAGAIRYGIVTACLEQANGGFYTGDGIAMTEPLPTICAQGSYQRLITANMVTLRRNCDGSPILEPVRTITAGAEHHAVVEYTLSPEHEAGALRVAAFLMRYYGQGGQHGDLRDPAATITTKDRLALVTVVIQGTPFVIVDIGLRMLQPHELFRAQGFPASYIIDRTADGRRVSNSRAVAMVGNSVSPPPLRALAEANLDRVEPWRLAA